MKKFLGLVLMLSSVGACSHGHQGGSDDKTKPVQGEGLAIFRCDSQNAAAKVRGCFADEPRAGTLGFRVGGWRPDAGHWLSLQFRTDYLRQTFNLTEAETKCLIQTFCQEKIP